MHGHKSHDTEVAASAADVWAAMRGLGLINIVNKELPQLGKIEVLEGDGSTGTVLKVTFAPGAPISGGMIQKISKVDDGARLAEVEMIEGGLKDHGFNYFKSIQQVVEKDSGSCIIKSSIECEYDENNAEAASHVNVNHLIAMAAAVAKNVEQK